MKIELLFCLMVAGAGFFIGNELRAEVRTYALGDVLQEAMSNNPTLQNSQARVDQLTATKNLQWAPLLPELTWTLGGASRKDAVIGGIARFGGKAYNQYSSDLEVTQTLFTKGLFSAVTASNYEVKIQQEQIKLESRRIYQQVLAAFYRLLLHQEAYQYLLNNQKIIDQAVKTTQKRIQTGRSQMLDLLQVKTQAAVLVPQLQESKKQMEIASQELLNLMGKKEGEELELKGKLPALYLKEIESRLLAARIELPEFHINNMRQEQLEYQRDSLLGSEFPTLRLTGNYFFQNSKKEELFEDYAHGKSILLELTVPIFNGLTFLNQRKSLASQRTQLELGRKELENDLNLRQQSGLKSVLTSESSLISAQEAVTLALEAQKEAQRIYNLSQIDFLQFLLVQQAALQAQLNFNNLKYENLLAHLNYSVASGYSLEVLAQHLMGK
jgi:outer membrane protein TolC